MAGGAQRPSPRLEAEWDVEEVLLVQSTLRSSGAIYEVLHRRAVSG
jgi:hypothetical protein